jgi:23S rRNA pseudoU1915 N3-methylase RlmH
METLHNYAVESDGSITDNANLTKEERRIIEKMARCSYMISMHREGIALNSRRLAELDAELQRLGVGL